jgi:hypothetical protein
MESDSDLFVRDGHVCRHVDEVAEDLSGLGVIVPAHAIGHQAIEAAGKDQQSHIVVDDPYPGTRSATLPMNNGRWLIASPKRGDVVRARKMALAASRSDGPGS